MQIAGCTWGLATDQPAAAAIFADAGLSSIDVDPGYGPAAGWDPPLPVTCLAAGHLFPGGTRLDDEAAGDRCRARDHVIAAFDEARRLGAEVVYVGAPDPGPGTMGRFAAMVEELSAAASERNLLFCVEPSPPRGLRTIAETVAFIERSGVANFHVLLDFAHCLLVGEDPVAAIAMCQDRLAYVHFNDTDGVADNHLGLTEGCFTIGVIDSILSELDRVSYSRALAIESSPNLADPLAAALKTLAVLRACGAR